MSDTLNSARQLFTRCKSIEIPVNVVHGAKHEKHRMHYKVTLSSIDR